MSFRAQWVAERQRGRGLWSTRRAVRGCAWRSRGCRGCVRLLCSLVILGNFRDASFKKISFEIP